MQASAVEPKLLISAVHSYFAVIAVRSDGIAEVVGSTPTRSTFINLVNYGILLSLIKMSDKTCITL
jgi:hypothetical protein